MKRQEVFSITYCLIAVVFLIIAPYLLIPETAETISYSQFKALLRSGQLGEVVIYDKEITGKVQPAGVKQILTAEKIKQRGWDKQDKTLPFRVVRVDDKDLTTELEKAGITFKGEARSEWSIVRT